MNSRSSDQNKKRKTCASPDAANKQTPSKFIKQHLDGKSCGIAEQCEVAEYSTAFKKSTPHGPTFSEDCPIEDEFGRISASDAYQIVSAYRPSSQHFIQLMRDSHLSSLYVPAHFAEHLPSKKKVELVIRDKDQKSWKIKTCYKKKKLSHSFSAGWPQFVRDNDIKVGDVLIIELDGVSELNVIILNVLILKVRDPGPAHVNKFLSLMKAPRSTGSSDPQNKKRQALATKRFEVRPPPCSYATRSTGPVATDSPPVTVHCHGFASRKPQKDCLRCSRCNKNFCIDSLVRKFHYVRATIRDINLREWVCPSCKGDCHCNDCKGKLIVDHFLDEPSPPPPSHALDEVVQRLVGRLKEYRQVFEAGLALIQDRVITTPNWKEEQWHVKQKNIHLQKEHKETLKSIREMLALLGPEDESIVLEFAELSQCDSEQEEEEVQEVQEEAVQEEEVQEEEATLVEDLDHPLTHLLTSSLNQLLGIYKRLGAYCDILQAKQEETVKLNENNKLLQANLIKKETFRRNLVNKLMDKRGNIRVFCRIRPRAHAGVGDSSIPFESNDKDTITLFGDPTKHFTFDQVFPVDASQEDIFLEISHLVDCAISGQKVCIFCYGRSGSGKTFSMYGGDGRMRGIIPRSFEKLFGAAKTSEMQGKETTFVVEMIEVLHKVKTKLMDPCSSKGHSKETLLGLLVEAKSKRNTKSTMLNTESSRSHVLLEIKISSTDLLTREASEGFLCFADLAGNESPDGDTASEGVGINKDLLELGKVLINLATARNSSCVLFRGCLLTTLLGKYLSVGSKTLTLLHIDPNSSRRETQNTLEFGKKAGSCKLAVWKSKTPRH